MQKSFDKKKFLSQNSMWLVLIVLVIIMSIAQPSFFSVNNLLTLLSGEEKKQLDRMAAQTPAAFSTLSRILQSENTRLDELPGMLMEIFIHTL
mgnify:CR=1 FL=1